MSSTTLRILSSDGQVFEVPAKVLDESMTIKNMIEDLGSSEEVTTIPLPNVSGSTLAKVLEYCKHRSKVNADAKANADNANASADASADANTSANASASADAKAEVRTWEEDFVAVDQRTLFDLILAANYLNIKGMLDLTCQTVASMIKGKTVEEIRKTFNIKNDFTPEEEEEIRRENQWAFE